MRARPSSPAPPPAAPFLEATYERLHRAEWIGADPLGWARVYDRREDREIAAFLAASLAYGNVRQIERSLADLFRRLGRSPARFVRDFVPGRSDGALKGFYHRFNDERDLSALLHLVGQMLRAHGSLEGFWHAVQPAGGELAPLAERAGRFMDAALALETAPYYEAVVRGGRASLLYLLPDAAGPSACKRFFLFLRWMVRPDDGIDLGLWRSLSPAELEYPVDTHILRLARYLGATRRRDAGARTRREITDFFRGLDPADPVRFDFSLCRLGIEKICPTRQNIEACRPCALRPACLRHASLTWPGRLPRRLARLGLIDRPARRAS